MRRRNPGEGSRFCAVCGLKCYPISGFMEQATVSSKCQATTIVVGLQGVAYLSSKSAPKATLNRPIEPKVQNEVHDTYLSDLSWRLGEKQVTSHFETLSVVGANAKSV